MHDTSKLRFVAVMIRMHCLIRDAEFLYTAGSVVCLGGPTAGRRRKRYEHKRCYTTMQANSKMYQTAKKNSLTDLRGRLVEERELAGRQRSEVKRTGMR